MGVESRTQDYGSEPVTCCGSSGHRNACSICRENSPTCSTCGLPKALEYCIECRGLKYYLSSNSREFLTVYGGASLGQFANRLYDFVSDISHSGKLLRAEMGDMGFNKVGKDEQTLFEIDVLRITRLAMVNWLKTGQCEDTGD